MFENIKQKKALLGAELIQKGLITQDQLEEALQYQKEHSEYKLGEIIDILNLCDKVSLLNVLAEQIGEKPEFLDKQITLNYSDYLPRDVVINNRALPFEVVGQKIKVAFSDPKDMRKVNEVKMLLLSKGYSMEVYIALYSSIMNFVNSIRSVHVKYIDPEEKDITILIDTIIMNAMEKRTSDIHIEPMQDRVRVRFRIDGELVTVAEFPKARQPQIIGRLKAMSNMHQEITYDQDGAINTYMDYSIRVSSQKNVYGEKFVLRLLKKNGNVRDLFDLGFPRDPELVKKAFDKRNSIILMCAPTGEGKTTSLYSVLDYLNKPEINIITIEDPVEIRMPGVSQVEIGPNVTFASALRTVLRQDPDIVLVGEIRDQETAQIAIEAGQTGHLVLSTVHTINAVESITRIRKMGISNYDISATLITAISQRLIRRLCPHCKKPHVFTEEELKFINRVEQKMKVKFNLEEARPFEAGKCEKCNNTGYFGRIAMFEILCLDDKMKDMIAEGESALDIREYAQTSAGYRPMIVDGVKKVLAGITTISEVEKKVTLG